MQIGVVGINHKLAHVELREAIAKACTRRFGLGNPLLGATFVLLSTCNRCELYFHAESPTYSHEQILSILKEEVNAHFDQKLYTFFGYDCFLHLARVTSGLDSAIIAETEIQGQVKTAYETATTLRSLPKDLHFLFQKSLKIAKDVRREHLLSCHLPNLEHALFWQAREYFEEPLPAPLFIGTSDINLKIARFLKQKGVQNLHFCNRTDSSSARVARELSGKSVSWKELKSCWQEFDFIISATKCPHHIIEEAPEHTRKTLLIDLAVPRNINPNLSSPTCKVCNIDDLNQLLETRKAHLVQKVISAESYVTSLVKRSVALFRAKSSTLPLAVSY